RGLHHSRGDRPLRHRTGEGALVLPGGGMSDLSQLYQQVILDHAKERAGHGLRPDADGESFQVNHTCGDEVRLQIHLDHSGPAPRIADITWDGVGCSISQASVSVLTTVVTGADVPEADRITQSFRE